MILRYERHMGGGSAVEYRGNFVIFSQGVVLVNDNADETFIPMHRVIDIERYRDERDGAGARTETLRQRFRRT